MDMITELQREWIIYNTSNYVPEAHVEKLFRQNWSGLDLDSIVDIGQDDHGNLNVLVRWYRFPEEEATELTIAQMLDGGHLILDKYLEENKSDIRPDLYKAVKQKIQVYQKQLKDTQVISVE